MEFESWGKRYPDSVQEWMKCDHNKRRALFMEDEVGYQYWDLLQYEIQRRMDSDTFNCLHKIFRRMWV